MGRAISTSTNTPRIDSKSVASSSAPARVRKPLNPDARARTAARVAVKRQLARIKDAGELRQLAEQLKASKHGGGEALPDVQAPAAEVAQPVAEVKPKEKGAWPSAEEVAAQENSARVIVETIKMGLASFDVTKASPLVTSPDVAASYMKAWQAALAEWETKAQLSPTWALAISSVGLVGMPVAAGLIQKKMAERAAAGDHLRAVPG